MSLTTVQVADVTSAVPLIGGLETVTALAQGQHHLSLGCRDADYAFHAGYCDHGKRRPEPCRLA